MPICHVGIKIGFLVLNYATVGLKPLNVVGNCDHNTWILLTLLILCAIGENAPCTGGRLTAADTLWDDVILTASFGSTKLQFLKNDFLQYDIGKLFFQYHIVENRFAGGDTFQISAVYSC